MFPHAGTDAAPVAGLCGCGGDRLTLGETLQMGPPNPQVRESLAV